MRVDVLLKLSQALGTIDRVSGNFFLCKAGRREWRADAGIKASLRFRTPTVTSADNSDRRFGIQQSSLQVLELVTAAAHKAQENPQLPARLLPLLRPMEQLLQQWGLTSGGSRTFL